MGKMVQGPITKIEPRIASRLSKQRYQLVGEHGGGKVCHWTKQSLIADRSCYKGTFYGIESHGCMQMAPNVDTCNLGCTYCWREPNWGARLAVGADRCAVCRGWGGGRRRVGAGG
ncbi:MAG: hypothetical protein MK168_00770, partial [Candidatus Thalassarchaeum sp.]|nr:hypothetical protein [Candidatus Thalassarchaeum sp.]